jgi:hypothetical protein
MAMMRSHATGASPSGLTRVRRIVSRGLLRSQPTSAFVKKVKNIGGKRNVNSICRPEDDMRMNTAIRLKTIARNVAGIISNRNQALQGTGPTENCGKGTGVLEPDDYEL